MSSLYPKPEYIPAKSLTNKCIVIDLDQTLIATQEKIESLYALGIMTNPKLMELRKRIYYFSLEDIETPGSGAKSEFWGVVRPHVYEFLIFCFSYFKVVAIWSAGQRHYVNAIVEYLFRDLPKPHLVLTHDDLLYESDGVFRKPLTTAFADPQVGKYMNIRNTMALDDNPMTYYLNDDNGLLIPEYDPSLNIDAFQRDDPTLLQLRYWLVQPEVIRSNDVRTLDKSTIFTKSVASYLAHPFVANFR